MHITQALLFADDRGRVAPILPLKTLLDDCQNQSKDVDAKGDSLI
jgi:hypothetical protein